ncbi:MAG TPA: DegT/DnrJ/EryC1/StrS family aminotransferase [Gemmatimonadales bacterium]|jgi:dTDP-4-amino-4,6-dideoxygalactose transaminase|nr:DegT/DnrJ/EryC1/StrS family aminotransferase [Gemmatimonadales bacterium]
MSRWRHHVPVRSPLSAAALVAGARAAMGNGRSEAAVECLAALLSERYSPKGVLLTDSGTTALRAALVSALGPGVAVALPAFACYDLVTAANGAGVPVVLYDTDPHTLAPDLLSLRMALRRNVGAIVVVHLYGYPVDLTEINALAADAGVVVIEDAAQAAGGTLHDRPLGAHASLAVLSFGRGKGMTGGGGGALLAHDEAGARILERARTVLAAPARGWSSLATLAAQMVLEGPQVYALPAALPFLHLGETVYRRPHTPRAASPASCAVVAATWELADQEVETRRSNAARLLAAVCGVAAKGRRFEPVRPAEAARPGYLRLPVLASPEARRAAASHAARRLGVSASYPKVLSEVEQLAERCVNRDGAFPGARTLTTRLITLPTHSRLGSHDLSCLERWIAGPYLSKVV